MSLGSLVSVVAAGVRNLTVCVLDNGLYEVTGGQKTPAFGTPLNYCDLARATGFSTVLSADCINGLQSEFQEFLNQPGPRFASLAVDQVLPNELEAMPLSLVDQVKRVSSALARQTEDR